MDRLYKLVKLKKMLEELDIEIYAKDYDGDLGIYDLESGEELTKTEIYSLGSDSVRGLYE